MDGRKTRERERERERAAGSRALPIIAQGRIAQRSRGANSNRSPKRRSRLRGERKLLHRRHSARRVRTAERGDWSDAIGDAAASVHSVHAFLYISLRAIRDASLSLARRASPSLFIDTDDATRRTAADGEFRAQFSLSLSLCWAQRDSTERESPIFKPNSLSRFSPSGTPPRLVRKGLAFRAKGRAARNPARLYSLSDYCFSLFVPSPKRARCARFKEGAGGKLARSMCARHQYGKAHGNGLLLLAPPRCAKRIAL